MPITLDPKIKAWMQAAHEIGMIEFTDTDLVASRFPHDIPGEFIPIALFEADALCIVAESGELIVFDHEVPNRRMCSVAIDQRAFLSALGLITQHFDKCQVDDNYYEDEFAARLVAEQCTALAGGDKYAQFYHSLIGA